MWTSPKLQAWSFALQFKSIQNIFNASDHISDLGGEVGGGVCLLDWNSCLWCHVVHSQFNANHTHSHWHLRVKWCKKLDLIFLCICNNSMVGISCNLRSIFWICKVLLFRIRSKFDEWEGKLSKFLVLENKGMLTGPALPLYKMKYSPNHAYHISI